MYMSPKLVLFLTTIQVIARIHSNGQYNVFYANIERAKFSLRLPHLLSGSHVMRSRTI